MLSAGRGIGAPLRVPDGNLERVEIENVDLAAPLPNDELLAADEALTQLAESEPGAAELVRPLISCDPLVPWAPTSHHHLRHEALSM
jgi:hypothetical protein